MWFAHRVAEIHVSGAVKIASLSDNQKSSVILYTKEKITGLQKLQSDLFVKLAWENLWQNSD